ncbi:MAG: hypothetical protein JXB33_04815, partial [Clostridia bacterium]|nr:hypothetical protein [Clostridia bacterium]
MNGFERIYSIMSCGSADCTPFMPKIWVRLACEITSISLLDILADPFLAMACTVRAGNICDADGARVFRFPKRQTARDADGGLLEVSGGVAIGRIDTKGGLSTYLYEDGTIDIGDEYEMAFVQFKKQKSLLVKSIADARRIAVPGKALFKDLGFDAYYKRILDESNGMAIAGDCGSATLSFYSHFRGSAQSLMDFYDEPGLVSAVMDKGVETAVSHGKFCIDSGLRILRLNDSTANMNVISPGIFRDFIKPRFREICEELHSYNKDVRIYCHNCGNIFPIMNDLVETGLDCIAPLDPLGGFSCADARAA